MALGPQGPQSAPGSRVGQEPTGFHADLFVRPRYRGNVYLTNNINKTLQIFLMVWLLLSNPVAVGVDAAQLGLQRAANDRVDVGMVLRDLLPVLFTVD